MENSQRILRLSQEDISKDIDLILWAFRLLGIRRYVNQPFWKIETLDAKYADRLESFPRMETVAEHSWTVADSVILLAPNFPYIHRSHAVELAVLHDKMEIVTGDMNPLGTDGSGNQGHAFNSDMKLVKYQRELAAIEWYLSRVRPEVAQINRGLLMESLRCLTPEARFVKSIDKMQALAFILLKKGGRIEDRHLSFLIRFTEQNDRYFPPLREHSQELLRRIFKAAAKARNMDLSELWEERRCAIVKPDKQKKFDLITPEEDVENPAQAGNDQYQSDRDISRVTGKFGRLLAALREVESRPPTRTGLEAYRQLSEAINRVEDMEWGDEYWSPPRHVGPGVQTDRLYPITPENIYPVPDYPGVDLLSSVSENLFISRTGAIEVQRKDVNDLFGSILPFANRGENVIFRKRDIDGDEVWHPKNKR